jgi:hypothetical protein
MKLWTKSEIDTLRQLYPDYTAVLRRLKHRSLSAVKAKASDLGITRKRRVWTAAQISKLRKLFLHGTREEIAAAFPGIPLRLVYEAATYRGLHRPRRPYKPTGNEAIDQIRERSFELGYSMSDVDALVRSRRYFYRGGWHSGHISHKAIGRAIVVLDGHLKAEWRTYPDD